MQIIPLYIEKEIEPSDDISELIVMSSDLHDGDILVVAQKIISKQEGRIVDLSTVKPSLLSEGIGSQYRKDSRIIELILSETKRIVRIKNGIIIDSHLSHYLPNKYVDLCVVTKCDLKVLEKRLKKKEYSKEKIRENLDTEIFDICLNEAKESNHKIMIVNTMKGINIIKISNRVGVL